MYIEGLHHSIRFSIRTYCGTNKDAIIQSFASYVPFLFKLRQISRTSSTATPAENRGQQKLSKNINLEQRPTAMVLITNKQNANWLS